jgi:hypothetical protein
MARTKFRKIIAELVVAEDDVSTAKEMLSDALDNIHEEVVIVTQFIDEKPTRRPVEADEYGFE